MFSRCIIWDVLSYEILFESISCIDDECLIEICQDAFEEKKTWRFAFGPLNYLCYFTENISTADLLREMVFM
jgi:hypothetical protein